MTNERSFIVNTRETLRQSEIRNVDWVILSGSESPALAVCF